ncbi:uncharacterized protein C594.04c [Olea europaea var. sylvestris]|uniref:uncharacterized protein C594.04c n=1 Tax=Olea europaea var. sylvestris TaxID=158386 RepID=UPI000C1D2A2D|nr:uncharacterized protein C594.04c [Olea europaea var. sylvestris]
MAVNIRNAVIAFLVPLPSILFYLSFLGQFRDHPLIAPAGESNSLSPLWIWCYQHPLLLANALFFLNVNLSFWIIGLLQSSHWMIDLYWTVIPLLLVHYFATHPLAEYNLLRSNLVIFLTWTWSVRLTHNYFRREEWQWGAREDWRFTDMRRQYGKNWWWVSFFAVYLSQQVFLMGICMPLYVVHSKNKDLNIWDVVAAIICLAGIVIAYHADTQLHSFVTTNNELKRLGQPVVPNLDKGLWQYSRHPNYFGEQLWWWGLFIFAWNLGCGWSFIGTLINSMCLAYVTVLVEKRMLEKDYRAVAYRRYQKTTSVWIPFFKKTYSGGKDKKI